MIRSLSDGVAPPDSVYRTNNGKVTFLLIFTTVPVSDSTLRWGATLKAHSQSSIKLEDLNYRVALVVIKGSVYRE